MLFRTLETVMICTGFKAFQLLYVYVAGLVSFIKVKYWDQ